jgi:hypothetical protein
LLTYYPSENDPFYKLPVLKCSEPCSHTPV